MELTEQVKSEITLAIQRTRGIDRRIVNIHALDDGRIIVSTGHKRAPKGGSGVVFEATKADTGEWSFVDIGRWKG